jgi:hypothetical protein
MLLAKPADNALAHLTQRNLPTPQPTAEVLGYRPVMLNSPKRISLPKQIPREPRPNYAELRDRCATSRAFSPSRSRFHGKARKYQFPLLSHASSYP